MSIVKPGRELFSTGSRCCRARQQCTMSKPAATATQRSTSTMVPASSSKERVFSAGWRWLRVRCHGGRLWKLGEGCHGNTTALRRNFSLSKNGEKKCNWWRGRLYLEAHWAYCTVSERFLYSKKIKTNKNIGKWLWILRAISPRIWRHCHYVSLIWCHENILKAWMSEIGTAEIRRGKKGDDMDKKWR